jgi:hypothetical protein
MADLTVGRGDMDHRLYLQGPVGRMADQAVRPGLLLEMRFMAIQTAGNIAMAIMTAGAEEFRMPAGRRGHLPANAFMAGKTRRTRRFYRILQRSQGFMGIGMAAQAVLDLEMRLPIMAKGAGDNPFLPLWQMFRMAV